MYIFCTICQDLLSFEKGAAIALHCGHSYHKTCIENWLKLNRTCPICKEIVSRKKLQRLFFSFRQDDPGTSDLRNRNQELNGVVEENMKDMIFLNFELNKRDAEIKKLNRKIESLKKTVENLTEKLEQLELRNKSKDLFDIIIPEGYNKTNPIVYNYNTSSFHLLPAPDQMSSEGNQFSEPEQIESAENLNIKYRDIEKRNSVRRQNSKNWKELIFELSEDPNKL